MPALIDSGDLLDDGPALRARLARDGYLFLRSALPAAQVQKVRREVYAALETAGWLAPTATLDRPVPSDRAVREAAPGYLDAYLGIQRSQAFHELAHTPSLITLLARILDEPILVHPRKIARTSLPRDAEYTPPHQDFRLIQGSVDTLTTWVPLGACPASLGSLRMLAGSHRRGLIDADPGEGPGGLRVDVAHDHPDWHSADYETGDVVIFTSLTVHGALPNTQDVLRFSADFRYQPLQDPVLAASLSPHYHPQVPDWPELTHGWTSQACIEPPAGVVLAGGVPPLDPTLSAPRSRLLASV